MNTKKIWANLGVSDLDRTTKFYTALGFKPNGNSKELTSFLVGEDDFIVHFFLKDVLQANVQGVMTDPQHGNEVVFTLSANGKAEVNLWAQEVKKAGGNIITEPETFGPGYYGFIFTDPDGHKFNVFDMENM